MRVAPTLTATAALALLAACGDTTPADQVEAVPMDAALAELEPRDDPLPEVPDEALTEIDFAGTYVRQNAAGTERLTLDPLVDNYEYVPSDGDEQTGSFSRMDDNRRIMIEDLGGRTAYFAIAENAIFRLPDADATADEISVAGQWRRDATVQARDIIIAEEGAEPDPAEAAGADQAVE